jgi:hypothetical protein
MRVLKEIRIRNKRRDTRAGNQDDNRSTQQRMEESMIEMRWLLDPRIGNQSQTYTLQYRYRRKYREPVESEDVLHQWSDWIDVPYVSEDSQ